MARPQRRRRIGTLPANSIFKPAGVPARELDEVVLTVDEFEALRLADFEGLYQEQAAERMGVSRQTFGRIVEAARKKVAQALVKGMALRIEGGQVEMDKMGAFECADCGHQWEVPFGTGRPEDCPSCQSKDFHRAKQPGAGSMGGRGCCHRNRHGGQGGHGRGHRGGRASAQAENKEANE